MAAAGKDLEEVVDFEDEEEEAAAAGGGGGGGGGDGAKKGHFVGVHSSGFRDFLLKPEILRALVDAGFEHPSEVQHNAIPQALLGMDVLCQAKSGMGKTAVFVLTTLNQLVAKDGETSVLVLCHTRELAFQIEREYERFSKYLPGVKTMVFFGGVPRETHVKMLREATPNIVVGTAGRIMDLVESGSLKLNHLKFFIVDECDRMMEELDMRKQVQKIFMATPHEKQVMMFSATLSEAAKKTCRKFMQDPLEIFVEDKAKLTLHGLQQYVVDLDEKTKNKKLVDLLDTIEFNQVVIFVSSHSRAEELNALLIECNFPSTFIHGGRSMSQAERLKRYSEFKKSHTRILVATDLFGRGIDIERVNVVINYDFPQATSKEVKAEAKEGSSEKSSEDAADQYLHRVGRAGRFGNKGLAISFVSSDSDRAALAKVQERFVVSIPEFPAGGVDKSTYM